MGTVVPQQGLHVLPLALGAGVAGRLRATHRARGSARVRASVRQLTRAFASPRGAALALTALTGLLASASGLGLGPGGTPADARPGCPYPLLSRGHVLCVSPEHYRLAGLGAERFAAGVVLMLLAVDLAVALAPTGTRHLP